MSANPTKKKKTTYFKKYDLYSDANPKDTIPVKYKNAKELKATINKLERLYKQGKYPHKRISQVANVLAQRTRVIGDKSRSSLASRYYEFLKKRTKVKGEDKRKKLSF
jgi:hypothetical protein